MVLFNSVLWDMRYDDFPKYERDVNDLAEAFAQYNPQIVSYGEHLVHLIGIDLMLSRALRVRERGY